MTLAELYKVQEKIKDLEDVVPWEFRWKASDLDADFTNVIRYIQFLEKRLENQSDSGFFSRNEWSRGEW